MAIAAPEPTSATGRNLGDPLKEPPARYEMSFGDMVAPLVAARSKILVPSLAVGVATLLLLLFQPNHYRSRAVISPTGEEGKQGVGALGALATIGIQLGGPSKIEDLDSLFQSSDLTARVFSKHDIWADVLGPDYDSASHSARQSFLVRLFSDRPPGPLNDWDAIRAAEGVLRIAINKKAGTLTISFESLSAESSSKIVGFYLDEAKNRLQDEALERAQKNKAFLEQQILQTSDALTRDRLFTLLGQEIEREMLARNREQYGFKVIDSPRIPDRKSGPHRLLASGTAALLCIVVLSWFFYSRKRRRE